MKTSLILTGLLVVATTDFACNAKSDKNTALHMYTNPVCPKSLPDPTVIEDNGVFYLYATEDIANVPILRSVDLVNWEQCGSVFSKSNRPAFVEGGGIWAPDINYVGDHYLLYYSMSVWGGEWACGIGVAESETPEGPWVDRGKLFVSSEIEVQNSIDPFYIEDDGKNTSFGAVFAGFTPSSFQTTDFLFVPEQRNGKLPEEHSKRPIFINATNISTCSPQSASVASR